MTIKTQVVSTKLLLSGVPPSMPFTLDVSQLNYFQIITDYYVQFKLDKITILFKLASFFLCIYLKPNNRIDYSRCNKECIYFYFSSTHQTVNVQCTPGYKYMLDHLENLIILDNFQLTSYNVTKLNYLLKILRRFSTYFYTFSTYSNLFSFIKNFDFVFLLRIV